MNISHEYKYVNSNELLYIYIDCSDEYEFGKEILDGSKSVSFISKLKKYITNNIDKGKLGIAIVVIDGVVIGSIALSAILSSNNSFEDTSKLALNSPYQTEIYQEKTNDISSDKLNTTTDKQVEKDNLKNVAVKNSTKKTATSSVKTPTKTIAKATTTKTTSKTTTVTTPKKTTTTTKTVAKTTTPTTTSTASKATTSNTSTTTIATTGPSIKLKTNGTVVTMNLEEYIIGVVAAEMPASFQLEALKAQAVAARTFAMKKTSQGITLVNSTAHQVYKNESQLRTLWGSSYDTYYNKIKNAVYGTKGQVMMYNGKYIDAMYFSMSNGKTELPIYVWSYSYPYLQCVSSNWETSLSNFQVSTNINYENVSSKLGITVNADTSFEILSYTPSGRIEKIKVGGTTFTGVKFRSLLGLRSTDISIVKHDKYITFVTKGYGHGVGMSQYGANGAAKDGYTYTQILRHYYPGISIVTK